MDVSERLLARFAAFCCAGLAFACGGDSASGVGDGVAPDDGPRLRTLEWREVGASSAAAAPRVVAELEPGDKLPDGSSRWKGQAPGGVKEVKLPLMAGGSPELPALVLLGKGKGKSLDVRLDGVDAIFNEIMVEVQMFTRKSESIDASLLIGGERMAQANTVYIAQGIGKHAIVIPMPGTAGLGSAAEVLRLDFTGNQQDSVAVIQVTLLRRDLTSFVPAVGAPASRLSGDHFRGAVGVAAGSALEVRVAAADLARGSRVKFAVGQVPGMAKVGQRLAVRVEVLDGDADDGTRGAQPVLETVNLDFGASGGPKKELGWHDGSIDLPREVPSGGSALVRLACPGDEGELALVAQPILALQDPQRAQPPPTVVLISSDTHRADHIGLAGAAEAAPVFTPTLDALGNGGVVFENCYSTTNVTTPSHVALLTGMHPRDVRIVTNRIRLADSAVTLAERFQEAGFMTLAVTSVPHLLDPSSGLGQGFHRMEGPQRSARDAEESIARALEWLGDADGYPVFLWLHLFDAHDPYGPPEPYTGKYYPEDQDPRDPAREWSLPENITPGWLGSVTDPDFLYAEYRAEVDYLDAELVKLLGEPRVQGGVVAFTADHGENFGEHDVWFSHGGLYPSTLHVPLLLRWPDGPRRVRSGAAVRQMDIGRTLLNLAGEEDALYPGRDLRWGLEEPAASNPRFFLSSHGIEAAIEADGWLLNLSLANHDLLRSTYRRPLGRVELFHIAEDPKGEVDVLEANLPRAKKMRKRLIEWLETAPATGYESEGTSSPEMEALLNELGYAQSDEPEGDNWWRPEEHDGNWENSRWNVMFRDD